MPTWLEEITKTPVYVAKSYPMFCTRGYAYQILRDGKKRATCDYGICSKSGDIIYFGILREILEIHYPGMLDLRCVMFLADWYDPTIETGVRYDEFGVTSIHSR